MNKMLCVVLWLVETAVQRQDRKRARESGIWGQIGDGVRRGDRAGRGD